MLTGRIAPSGMERRRRTRILILSAPVGMGHESAARAIAADLRALGCEVRIEDGLRLAGGWAEWLVITIYRFQLERAPWSYEALYRAIVRVRPLARFLKWLPGFFGGRALRRLLRASSPDLVVTTFHLASAMLERERRKGRATPPVVAVVTDVAPHPMWVYPRLDLHLVMHERTAELIRREGARASVVRPPVGESFFAPAPSGRPELLEAGAVERLVLVMGGAWGVGSLGAAAEACAHAGWRAVVLAGRNERIRERLAGSTPPGVTVLGFTDEVPSLLTAADAVIVSGPGLSCLEAFARGVPVVFFAPIPGHGIHNARLMEECGLVRFARDAEQLVSHLRAVAAEGRPPEARRAARLFEAPRAAETVLGLEPARGRPRRRLRRVGVAALVAVLALASLASGAGVRAETRVFRRSVVTPARGGHSVALCIRLGPRADVLAALSELKVHGAEATFFVSGSAAQRDPATLRAIVEAGDEVGNGGERWGIANLLVTRLARESVLEGAEDIRHATGRAPRFFLPARGRLSLISVIGTRGEKPILGGLRASRLRRPGQLASGDIIVVDLWGRRAPSVLRFILDAAGHDGLRVRDVSQFTAERGTTVPVRRGA